MPEQAMSDKPSKDLAEAICSKIQNLHDIYVRSDLCEAKRNDIIGQIKAITRVGWFLAGIFGSVTAILIVKVFPNGG